MTAPRTVVDRLAQAGERLTSDRAIAVVAVGVVVFIAAAAVAQALIRWGVI